jgi:hypothetical protein
VNVAADVEEERNLRKRQQTHKLQVLSGSLGDRPFCENCCDSGSNQGDPEVVIQEGDRVSEADYRLVPEAVVDFREESIGEPFSEGVMSP